MLSDTRLPNDKHPFVLFVHFQLYVGDGSLQANTTYTVVIYNLGVPNGGNNINTVAFINSQQTTVEYLTPVSQESALDIQQLQGELFIGGYRDVSDLSVSLALYLIFL